MKKSTPYRLVGASASKPVAAARKPGATPPSARPAKWTCPRCGTRKLLRDRRRKRGGDQRG